MRSDNFLDMDDRQFDKRTAQEWVDIIECEGSNVREKDLYPLLCDWLKQSEAQMVLDIGCGQGICSDKIELKDRSYVGIDPSTFLLDRANQLYSSSNRKFILGNAYLLPVADRSFDAAFSVAVWHLLEDKQKAARELSRVLKEHGSFLIATANPDKYEEWASNYESSKRNGSRFEGVVRQTDGSISTDILYFHSYDEILKSFADAQLVVNDTKAFRTVILIKGQKNSVN